MKGDSEMKKTLFLSITLLMFGIMNMQANAQSDGVVVLANSTDYAEAWGLVGFIQKNEVSVFRAVPQNFNKYKNEKHIIVLVGPSSKEGMEPIFEKALTPDEQAFLKTSGNRKMYYKKDIWTSGQEVLVFGFSDDTQIKPVLVENRRPWIEHLIEWFDLEISWEDLEY